jgi:hypothetical protein
MNSVLLLPMSRRLAFWVVPFSMLTWVVAVPVCIDGLLFHPGKLPNGEVFVLRLTVSMAAAWGFLLSVAVKEFAHMPVGLLLPGVKRQLQVWLAGWITLAAVLATALQALLSGNVPLLPFFALCWWGGIFYLPVDERLWFRLLRPFYVVGLLFVLARADLLLVAMRTAPVSVTLSACFAATVCWYLGFAREDWRRNALVPWFSGFALFGNPAVAERRDAELRKAFNRFGWGRVLGGQRTLPKSWIGVALREVPLNRTLFVAGVCGFLLPTALPFLPHHSLAQVADRYIGQLGRDGRLAGDTYSSAMEFGFLPLIWISSFSWIWGLRKNYFYPVSRAERAAVSWRICLVFTVSYTALILLSKVAVVGAAVARGWRPAAWPTLPSFLPLTFAVLTEVPIVQWMSIRRDGARADSMEKSAAMLVPLLFAMVAPPLLAVWLSPLPLALVFLGLSLLANAFLYLWLKKHYATVDLVST